MDDDDVVVDVSIQPINYYHCCLTYLDIDPYSVQEN